VRRRVRGDLPIAFLTGRFQTTEEIPEGVEKVRFVEQSLDAEAIASAFG